MSIHTYEVRPRKVRAVPHQSLVGQFLRHELEPFASSSGGIPNIGVARNVGSMSYQ